MSDAIFRDLSSFWDEAASNADTLWVGIDPGTNGAIGFIAGQNAMVVDIPVSRVANARGRLNGVYDLSAIIHMFGGMVMHVSSSSIKLCLEQSQPMPTDNPFVAFRCGEGFAMWSLYLRSLYISFETVRPAVWKKSFGLQGGATNKEAARLKALSLWPKLAEDGLKRKKDHNRAEALLLAEYLRRSTGGNNDKQAPGKNGPRRS